MFLKIVFKNFENIENTKKVLFENSSLCFKFSIFFCVFYVFQKKNKQEIKHVFFRFICFPYF